MNDLELVKHITEECERSNINLCRSYSQWMIVAFAISELGESGREYFHRLSRIDDAYRVDECNRKYDNVLCRRKTTRGISLGTLVHEARRRGVKFLDKAHQAAAPSSSSVAKSVSQNENSVPAEQESRAAGLEHPKLVRATKWPRCAGEVASEMDITEVYKRIRASCNLCTYLLKHFVPGSISRVVNAYKLAQIDELGRATVYPQIDVEGRLRAAKIIRYDAETGHRDKSTGAQWLHSYLRLRDFDLRQCLFGEHLLAERPDAVVGLVEAEKTAVICAMTNPSMVWVATGGKQGLSAERLEPLRGRKVVVFADADAADEWQERLSTIAMSSSWCFSNWHRGEDSGSHRDIADLM